MNVFLPLGRTVMVDCVEGFGGKALVVDSRDDPAMPSSRWKVRMLDRPHPDFWAFDAEIRELGEYLDGDLWDEI